MTNPIPVHTDLYHLSESEVISAQFFDWAMHHARDDKFIMTQIRVDSEVEWEDIAPFFDIFASVYTTRHGFGNHDTLVLLGYKESNSYLIRFAGDAADVHAFEDKFRDVLHPIAVKPSTIPYSFWCLDSKGNPRRSLKRLGGNNWDQISGNYPKDTRNHLDRMISLRPPEGGGKIILWHGVPGTGKTNFIRALATGWQEWCSIEYVLDPEQMFDQAHYMNSAFIDYEDTDKWRLMILEDSGEFVLEKSKVNLRQGFSRLLNLADGIMGQGLRLIILITTNEPMKSLHPAITRPGRCLANIEFSMFDRKEAHEWLGYAPPADADHFTLAALYELRAEEQQIVATAEDHSYRPGVYA